MRFGPHSSHVDELLDALADPEVRRRGRRRYVRYASDHRLAGMVYRRVVAAGRLEMWDDARMTAGGLAVPSQANEAAGIALALVASDLLDDVVWLHFTDTPLSRLVGLQRPGGVLAERCPCGHQLGERLVSAKMTGDNAEPSAGALVACWCVTSSLPSVAAVEIAFGLVRSWDSADWETLVDLAVRLGRLHPRRQTPIGHPERLGYLDPRTTRAAG